MNPTAQNEQGDKIMDKRKWLALPHSLKYKSV
jgi:hypothetical protein